MAVILLVQILARRMDQFGEDSFLFYINIKME